MNPKHTIHRPRFVCRLVRAWSSLAGGSFPDEAGPAARHAAGCDDCREFFSAADELEQELRRSARGRVGEAPDGLEARINLAVLDALPGRGRPARRSTASWAIASLAGAAAVALLLMVILSRPSAPSPDGSRIEIVEASGGVPDAGGPRLIDLLPAGLQPAVRTENPLERELDAVYADTRSALRFLAVNFLPTVPAALAPADPPAQSAS